MKKFWFVALIILVFSMTSCVKSYSSIKPEEYSSYVKVVTGISSSAFDYSPMSYNVLKGVNPYSDYTIKAVNIETPRAMYSMYGDPLPILNTMFPDADLIVAYNTYFYICYKNKKE